MSIEITRHANIMISGETEIVFRDDDEVIKWNYVAIENAGTSDMAVAFVSGKTTADADAWVVHAGGSISIPMGSKNTIYITGDGAAQIFGYDDPNERPFKSASKGGDTPAVDAYTKTETDMLFAKKADTYTNTETDILLSCKFNAEKVVDTLPEVGETNTLYIVKDDMSYVYVIPTRAWQRLINDQKITVSNILQIRDTASGKYMTCSIDTVANKVTFMLHTKDGNVENTVIKPIVTSNNVVYINTSMQYVYYGYGGGIIKYSDYGWSDNIEYSDSFSDGGWTKIDNIARLKSTAWEGSTGSHATTVLFNNDGTRIPILLTVENCNCSIMLSSNNYFYAVVFNALTHSPLPDQTGFSGTLYYMEV